MHLLKHFIKNCLRQQIWLKAKALQSSMLSIVIVLFLLYAWIWNVFYVTGQLCS